MLDRDADLRNFAAVINGAVIRAFLAGSRCCSAAGISVDAYAPVCALARKLLQNGFVPERMLEVYRGTTLCFRVPLAVAANLTVKDRGDTGAPHFVLWRQETVATAPPVAPNVPAATAEPTARCEAVS